MAAIASGALLVAACGSDASSTADQPEPTAAVTTAPLLEPDVREERWWVEPDLADCIGEAPQQCLRIARSDGGETEFLYEAVEGFEFVEGTRYVIDVRVSTVEDPPADGSSLRYELIEVIEATEDPVEPVEE